MNRVVAVWGPRGAPGCTTVAIGLAYESARAGRSTIVLDADRDGGSVTQHLRIENASHGALVRSWHDRLSVVAGVTDRAQSFQIPSITPMINAARERGNVVIDVRGHVGGNGRDMFADPDDWTLDALELADVLVVVGLPDPVGLSRLTNALLSVRDWQSDVVVVINQMRSSLGWGLREISAMLTGIVRPAQMYGLPFDQDSCDQALTIGRPVNSLGLHPRITRGFADIAWASSLVCRSTNPHSLL